MLFRSSKSILKGFVCFFVLFKFVVYSQVLSSSSEFKPSKPNPFKKVTSQDTHNIINSFLNDKALSSSNLVRKQNYEITKESLLRAKYNKAFLTKNIKLIKEILSTETGIIFINECKNKQENQKLWKLVIEEYHIETLKLMKSLGIIMTLSNDELFVIIKSFRAVRFYETFEFLLYYIELTEEVANELIALIFDSLQVPLSKEQQNSQLEIIKKLVAYPKAKNYFKTKFYNVIASLNIGLATFAIHEFDMDINDLFNKFTVLNVVVRRLFYHPNEEKIGDDFKNFAYEMFDYLLAIGANIHIKDSWGSDIYYYIERIRIAVIKNKLKEIMEFHKLPGIY